MSIRDRVTVKTVQGDVVALTVAKQGGSIAHTMPKRPTGFFEAVIQDKNGEDSDERLTVPADQVSYILFDREERKKVRAKA